MNGCELAIAVTALASAVAAQIEDDADLSILAAAATQFGDSLTTIAAWRARCAVEQARQGEPEQKPEQAGTGGEAVVQ